MTPPGAGGRMAHLAIGVLATFATGSAVTACGASANGIARQACTYVDRSIGLLHRASTSGTPAAAAVLRQHAYTELLLAIPIAAQAAYHDDQYQALVYTLSESNRVPEQTLVPSLQAQCRSANGSVLDQPPPGTIPPPASGS